MQETTYDTESKQTEVKEIQTRNQVYKAKIEDVRQKIKELEADIESKTQLKESNKRFIK